MRSRLSYANVVATLALFLALGGASYAALTLPRNSVGTPQLRDGSVTPRKLGFSVGLATGSLQGSVSVGTAAANCGSGPAICSQEPPLPTILASTSLSLQRPAKLLLLGTATVYQPNSAGLSGAEFNSVSLGLRTEDSDTGLAIGEDLRSGRLDVADEFSTTISFQHTISAAAGHHRYSLTVDGFVSRPTRATEAQVVAVALPPTP